MAKLNVSRLKGLRRKYFYDPFFIECRANGSLIQHGLNGQITAACYGWIDVPIAAENLVARRFNIHPSVWNKPVSASNQKVRGILFEWIDAQPLSEVPISSDIADQVRTKAKALHSVGIVHNSLAASNILVQAQDPNATVHLIDLGSSITLPHIQFSLQKLKEIQQKEIQLLEFGFKLLSENPINRGLCVADMSTFSKAILDEWLAESQFIKHLWAPPPPTCWQGT
ncbi:hypothetical protein A1O3_03603 [Capronia epimyces CBS 606.96]|uniref:Protein kinase domain-containing protein n=1 Tax=Capronia epimyces CBS 606.96 TaxID=1182542 RepID=W9YAG5_9EURO|nr:uncharacterized protein A1O3_03603 [Capronia epimyces CBS 606.96]EXJ86650.1 hypothetical protein A1O3_03603 [Capronia epimyces CBS 606.96]